ncbi:MAG TPA: tetratricopeptide repeat protein [Desulfobacteraceae bacterium]|nr:tetratricopeptide repeat protein [Desulfobacteraceae bacterium]
MCARVKGLPAIFGLVLLFLIQTGITGCQPANLAATLDPGSNSVEAAAEAPVEEPDYGCAYFYFLWGRQAELAMQFAEALEAYEKALICDPEADYIIRKIPVILLRMGRGDDAVAILQEYLEKNPLAAGFRMLLARVYIALSRNQEAAEQYRIIHRQDPGETGSLMLLSELYLNQGNLAEAEKALQQVLSVNPDSYPARVLLARIYLSIRKYDRALDEYDRALALRWSTDLLLEKSDVYRLQEKYGELIDIYREILRGDPSNERVVLGLVNFLLVEGREDEALAELNRFKERSADPAGVDISMARLYARLEKFDQAIDILRGFLLKENSSDARYLLAVILTQKEQYEQALTELRRIPRDAEEYENSVILQVRILRFLERPEQAVELLEKAVQDAETRSPDMYVMLAALYKLQDQTDLGRRTFDRALLAFPENEDLLYEYGIFLDTAGRRDEAISIMEELIRRQPEHGEALNYVGYTWADKSINLDKALEYIERAVQLKPDNGYILDSLGWVYYRLGRVQEALEVLQEAVQLSPDDPTIWEHLGDVYLALDREDEALETYRKAISLFNGDSRAGKALEEKVELLENRERK